MEVTANVAEEDELAWRPLTDADVPAVADLMVAAETVDDEGESWGAEDLAEELAGPGIDRRHGAFGAFTRDGRPVAMTLIWARTAADPVHEMFTWAVLHPRWRGRGIGADLTERGVAAAAKISALRFPGAPAVLQRDAYERRTDLLEHLERHGFTARHYDIAMERRIDPEDAGAEPAPPKGYGLARFTAEVAEEFRTIHNVAFVLDHPGSTVQTPEYWAARVGSESFRADLTFGLREQATGELAGYVLSRYYEADTAATGRRDVYLDYIGTGREHRGRGVASALIATVVHTAARQGFDSASLSMRSDNPSGALGVYERAGFALRRRFVSYARDLS
ncbi:MAG: GNAT family N-acetyltransferase [Actinocrinis sp.]